MEYFKEELFKLKEYCEDMSKREYYYQSMADIRAKKCYKDIYERIDNILERAVRKPSDTEQANGLLQRVSNNEVAVGCGTCKHGDNMPDENPCFSCIENSSWKQDPDC